MDCNYFKNPFKVCSDEWADRSLINSIIWTSTSRLDRIKEDMDDYDVEIQRDKEVGSYPNLRCDHMEKEIEKRTNELFRIKHELSILKMESVEDKRKLELYWKVHD